MSSSDVKFTSSVIFSLKLRALCFCQKNFFLRLAVIASPIPNGITKEQQKPSWTDNKYIDWGV